MPTDLSPLWISLKVALLGTTVTFFAGIAAAYGMLNYRGKGKSLIEGFFIAPLILPPTVVGFLLLLLLGKNGPLGQFLALLDQSVVFTWLGAVITATVVSFPLMYKTTLGAFEQIDLNLLSAARTLGSSEWQLFLRIMLPLAMPGLLAGVTLAFARALGEFGATLMLAGNIPGQTQTIPMAIYFAVEAGAMSEAWFWSILILCISLSGITIVSFWQNQQKQQIFSSFPQQNRKLETGDQYKTRAIQSQKITPFHDPPGHNRIQPSLDVEIQKQLSGFQLQVSFRADAAPLGILGGSGAGKSMILRCIAGVETPTQGRIVLNGKVLFDSERGINLPSCQRRVGYLFQNYALFPHLTVAQNIVFGLPHNLSQRLISQQLEAQLMALKLTELAHRYPHQLSGGQQQRVALARALAIQPEILLLDEPFSALDTYLRSQIEHEFISQLSHFPGVSIFVTHNLEEAYRICQNILALDQGAVIAQGNKQTIFEHPGTFGVAQLTGCKNFSRAIPQGTQQIEASDWGCTLSVIEPIPETLSFIGIRAHQIVFTSQPSPENTFPCWLASMSETPHRVTLFLKLHAPSTHVEDYHLQAEVFKEKWATIKAQPFPWLIYLDPLRLILLDT